MSGVPHWTFDLGFVCSMAALACWLVSSFLFAYRSGSWWLPATMVCLLVALFHPVIGTAAGLPVQLVLAGLLAALALAAWHHSRVGPGGAALCALPAFWVLWAPGAPGSARFGPEPTALGVVLVCALLNFAASRPTAVRNPAVQALHVGLLLLITAAALNSWLEYCAPLPWPLLLLLWLPPAVEGHLAATDDQSFGMTPYHLRALALTAIVAAFAWGS